MNLTQQRQVERLFEIGNKDVELVPGKTINRLNLNRVLFDGPSILKYYAYAYVPINEGSKFSASGIRRPGGATMDSRRDLIDHFSSMVTGGNIYNEQYAALIERIADWLGFGINVRDEDGELPNSGWSATPEDEIPGTGDFWANLSSELFERPIGITLELGQKTPSGEVVPYGGIFLEDCIISNYSLRTTADQKFITEDISIEVGKVKHLKEITGEHIIEVEDEFKNWRDK